MKKFLIVFILAFCVAIPGCKKDPVFYTITSSVSSGGTIDPLGISSVEAGSSIIYTIKPDANCSISSIKVDGVDFPVSSTIEIKNVSSNTEIKVLFTVNTYTISASADFGVDLTPSGVFTGVKEDTTLVFVYKAVTDRSIRWISVNGNGVFTNQSSSYYLVGEDSILVKAKDNYDLHLKSISNDSLEIMAGPWYLQESWLQDLTDSTWAQSYLDNGWLTEKLVFSEFGGSFGNTEGGSATWYDKNGKISGGPYGWYIKDKILNIGSNYTIVYLDNRKMVLDAILNDGAYISRDTYTHTPKKL